MLNCDRVLLPLENFKQLCLWLSLITNSKAKTSWQDDKKSQQPLCFNGNFQTENALCIAIQRMLCILNKLNKYCNTAYIMHIK